MVLAPLMSKLDLGITRLRGLFMGLTEHASKAGIEGRAGADESVRLTRFGFRRHLQGGWSPLQTSASMKMSKPDQSAHLCPPQGSSKLVWKSSTLKQAHKLTS